MIRAHEMNEHETTRNYWVEDSHRGNGLEVGAIATAIPAAVISLGALAKEWLAGSGKNTTAANVAALVNTLAPTLSAMFGRTVTGCSQLNPAEIKIAEQQAEIAMLKSENYSDKSVAELNKSIAQGQKDQFEYSLNLERRIGVIEGEQKCMAQRFNDYKVAVAEKSILEKQVVDGEIARVADSVTCLAGKLDQTNLALNATNARISAITKVVVPESVVCGQSDPCNGNRNGQ